MVDLGASVARGKNVMASVTVGAARSNFIRSRQYPAVNALPVLFDGMSKWNVVSRKKIFVAVAGSAGIGQIFLCNR